MDSRFPRRFFGLFCLLLGAIANAQVPAPRAPENPPQEQVRPEPEKAAQAEKEKPRISDLTDPLRTIWPKTESAGRPRSAGEALRMVPGRGGDALAGLVESEADLSSDLRLLLDVWRNPVNAARERAVAFSARNMKPFLLFNTAGIPRWSEREERDGLGRITSMTDALGNRVRVRYDDRGFAGVQAEPVGPLNQKWGDAGRLTQQNPERGAFQERQVFDYTPFAGRAGRGARLGASPLSQSTRMQLQPDGGRSFVIHDLMGRPIYTYDSKGQLSLNRYGPGGQLMGSYDARGRLTLFGHDRMGRRNFAVDSAGNRVLVDQDRMGSTVLGTAGGSTVKAGGAYAPMKPMGTLGGEVPAGRRTEGGEATRTEPKK